MIEKVKAASTLGDILTKFKGEDKTKDLGAINSFVEAVTDLALGLTSAVALIMFMYGAFLYVTSYGDEGKIENAKKTMLWSIMGLAVIAAAWFLTNYLKKSLT